MPEFSATRRSFLAATGTGAVTLSLAGCIGGDGDDRDLPGDIDPDEIQPGGEFTIGLSNELEAMNALTASSAAANAVLDLLYQPGVVVEPGSFEAMPWVFTDWEAEETTDGMEIYVSVREDLRWTDGEAFTVEDVLFTYEYYMEQAPGRFLPAIGPMESIAEDDGEYDLDLTLSEPIGTYEIDQLGLRLLPEHVWSGVDHVTHRPDTPVGLGPGRVASADPDTAVEVTLTDEWPLTRQEWIAKHDLFIEGGPFLDTVQFRVLDGETALQRAFLNGEIDAIYDGAFDVTQAGEIENREGLGLIGGRDEGYSGYTVNMRNPPFDDQAFRQALSMAMDRSQWVKEMERGYAISGSFVVPPAFEHLRPETAAGEAVQQDPDEEAPAAVRALWFREDSEGGLDAGAIRDFLESGAVISGSEGSYAGSEYPGSLTEFGGTAQTEATYDYGFGEVRSSVLEAAGVDRELYVDGRTIEELNDGPITMLNYPPDEDPRAVEFTQNYVRNVRQLGIPIEQEIATRNSIAERAYLEADFDIYPMRRSNFPTRGVSSLYSFFHSDNAHAEGSGFGTVAYNASGYGLDGLPGANDAIDAMRAELDEERRNELVREVTERIYLEAPTLVRSYGLDQWPVNEADFAGFIPEIPGVGGSNLWMQALNLHRR